MGLSASTSSPESGHRRELTADLLQRAGRARGAHRRRLQDRAVVANLMVARSIGRRFRGRGVPVEDLEQVAVAALVRAVRAFDTARHTDLLSYAVPSMQGEVRRYFRDHGWTVRPPRRVQELQSRVIELRDGRRGLTMDEMARELGVPRRDVVEALQAEGCFRPLSLDAPVAGGVLGDVLAHRGDDRDAAEARLVLGGPLQRLPGRDRAIIGWRFFDDCSQREIAERLGVTQAQVSRLLRRILADLRGAVGDIAA